MIRLSDNSPRGRIRRAGFTLIELLVVITVIGILSAITLAALNSTRNATRATKTKALIAKLDYIIRARYEAYRTRRVPISTRGMPPKDAAEQRLAAIRDLIRMEMPDRPRDFVVDPTDLPYGGRLERPALSQIYWAKHQAHNIDSGVDTAGGEDGFASAECLYMIVMSGSTTDREQFKQTDIGDVDGDGWPEFIDGWGRPIMFLRWAPGFSGPVGPSEIQRVPPAKTNQQTQAEYERMLAEAHDPFDIRNTRPLDYHLTPLIYSGGPDKKYGIELAEEHAYDGDPYSSTTGLLIGEPVDTSHDDNIHNHYIEAR